MEPITTLAAAAAGYILKAAAESNVFSNVKEEILSKFWHWIKGKLGVQAKIIEQNPLKEGLERSVEGILVELMQDDPSFKSELAAWVTKIHISNDNSVHNSYSISGNIVNNGEGKIVIGTSNETNYNYVHKPENR